MEWISGDAETRADDGDAGSRMHLRSGAGDDPVPVRSDLTPLTGAGPEKPGESTGRAGQRPADLLKRARGGAKDTLHRAGETLDERTGLVSAIREQPLAAVGIAFSAGFLAAALTPLEQRSWIVERGRRQLRRAILSGLTATLVHDLRDVLGGASGVGELIHSAFANDQDESDDSDDYL